MQLVKSAIRLFCRSACLKDLRDVLQVSSIHHSVNSWQSCGETQAGFTQILVSRSVFSCWTTTHSKAFVRWRFPLGTVQTEQHSSQQTITNIRSERAQHVRLLSTCVFLSADTHSIHPPIFSFFPSFSLFHSAAVSLSHFPLALTLRREPWVGK